MTASLAAQSRAARGALTQAEVAGRAGVKQQRVAELEAGRAPTAATLRRLAGALGCTFQICGDTDVGESRPRRPSDGRGQR